MVLVNSVLVSSPDLLQVLENSLNVLVPKFHCLESHLSLQNDTARCLPKHFEILR